MNFKIFDGRSSFYQWDLNQKLIVDGITLNDEIHFKNIDGVNALVVKPYSSGENILVDVPNILLQKANSITVWVYVNNDHTKEQAVFNVIPRQKPADYIYTPTEVSVWKVLEEAVENIPNEYAKKNHVHSQYLTAETDPSVEDWAKKGSEYNITGNPVTLENIEHMPMKVVTTLEPVQSGSGDPSPNNIRTISGWTRAGLTRCGKNLIGGFAGKTQNGLTFTINADGSVSVNGTSTAQTELSVPIYLPAGNYYLSGCPAGGTSSNVSGGYAQYCYINGSAYKFDAGSGIHLNIAYSQEIYVNIVIRGGTTINKTFYPQIETGYVKTDYEPYTSDTYSADFGQTVYGGTLDWQTGVLTVDWAMHSFTGEEDINHSTSGKEKFTYYGLIGVMLDYSDGASVAPIACSHFKPVSADVLFATDSGYSVAQSGQGLWFHKHGFADLDEFKAYLAAQYAAGTPVQIAYKLATPQTIQLTAHEIEALQGVNTLYGDGSLTVSGSKDVYWLSKNLVERIKTLESAIISLGGNV